MPQALILQDCYLELFFQLFSLQAQLEGLLEPLLLLPRLQTIRNGVAGESAWCSSSRGEVSVEVCGERARVKVFQAFTLRKVIELAAEGVRKAVSNEFTPLIALCELSTNWHGGAAA